MDFEAAVKTLEKYWGYKNFRPAQKPLVEAVMSGKNCIGLLPTGAGKSICYQVPILCSKGIGVVISPLISLMEDQAQALKTKGIPVVNLSGNIPTKDLDRLLDNCVYGGIKFLFLSPERLKNDLVKTRLSKMDISLLVVDEAHCISQWGHDFRPAYLEIPKAFKESPQTLALTATATEDVVKDMEHYLFAKKPSVLRGSFMRENLGFFVKKSEQKEQEILKICRKQKASGIIYTRSRRNTSYYVQMLKENDIVAFPYHAGLSSVERELNQERWIESDNAVMVATSAFGMGIDKPNVRFVIHPELPESIEAFIQEAGRAGRDKKKAFSVVLYSEKDRELLKSKLIKNPIAEKDLRAFYLRIMNYAKIAFGSGLNTSFQLELKRFNAQLELEPNRIIAFLNALKNDLFIDWNPPERSRPFVKIEVNANQLYNASIKNKTSRKLIEALSRMYHGIFESAIPINLINLGKLCGLQVNDLEKELEKLQAQQIISYYPTAKNIQIRLLRARPIHNEEIRFPKLKYLNQRSTNAFKNLERYLDLPVNGCRQQFLCEFFSDYPEKCGNCDLCLLNQEKSDIYQLILEQLNPGTPLNMSTLKKMNPKFKLEEKQFLDTLRMLMEENKITIKDQDIYLQ